jgi:hypothetical protein
VGFASFGEKDEGRTARWRFIFVEIRMNKALFDQLNSIYKPMWNKALDVKTKLMSAGYITSLGFYNNHYLKDGNDFTVAHFPIPIITIAEIGDIGIDIDNYWVEIHLDKNRAISLDYPKLTKHYNLEVYGSKDFCFDFYNKLSDPFEVAEKINKSDETQINVTFYFCLDSDINELVDLVKQFAV